MEKRDSVEEKDDLAQAKRDLLMRFIKDQESLQTSQNDFNPSNNDATFDILDGLTVSNEESREFYNKGISNMANNMPKNVNENGSEKPKPDIIDQKRSRVKSSRTSRPKDCLRSYIRDSTKVNRSDRNLVGTEEKIHVTSALKLENNLHSSQRPTSRETVRTLRSAPSLSVDPRHFIRQKEINVFEGIDLKSRKLSSLSIVVPTETEMKQDSSRCVTRRHSVTRTAHITRPLNVGSVAISSVDVEMLDKRTVSSLTAPYAMFHLPPIASETNSTPPST